MTDLVALLRNLTSDQRSAYLARITDPADLDVVEAAIAEANALAWEEHDDERRRHEHESTMARHARWYVDPVDFVNEAIRWPEGRALYAYQAEALTTLARHHRLALRSLHGAAKTATAALAVLWFAATREQREDDWKVITTASVWRQLKEFLWPEIHKWERRLDWDALGMEPWRKGRESLDMAINLAHGSAFAAASNEPAKLEGAHADQLLFVLDEAKTIVPETFDAAEGAMSGAGSKPGVDAFVLAGSTPGVPAGRFHAIHTRKPGTEPWRTQHITLDQAIAAGAVTQAWADSSKLLWAATPGIYANRVLGEFAEDEGGLIKLSWVEAANARWHALMDSGQVGASEYLGIDVARFGSDQTVVVGVAGDLVGWPVVLPPGDSIATADAALPYTGLGPHGPLVVIDANGVGAGVYDQLRRHRELPARIATFDHNARTDWRDVSGKLRFANTRAAAWWHMAELLNPSLGATLALPPDDELTGDLVAPTWRETSQGILIESKDDMRSRLGRSPDKGDTAVYALWGRILRAQHALRPARASNGHGPSSITGDLLEAML